MRTLNTKSKSGSGAGLKKEYYLAKYLQFLNPFSKSRPQGGNTPVQTQETAPDVNDFTAHGFNIIEQPSYTVSGVTYADEDPRTQEMQSPPAHSSAPLYSSTPSMSTTQSTYIRKKQMSEADKCAVDYFTSKKKKMERTEQQKKDPCELFLLSLVPHMASMSQQQQLQFQKGVLDLIENIKYRKPSHRTSDYSVDSPNSNAASFYNNFSNYVIDDHPQATTSEVHHQQDTDDHLASNTILRD